MSMRRHKPEISPATPRITNVPQRTAVMGAVRQQDWPGLNAVKHIRGRAPAMRLV